MLMSIEVQLSPRSLETLGSTPLSIQIGDTRRTQNGDPLRGTRMKLHIAVLAGDGIGPEVTREAINILRKVAEFGDHEFRFTEARIGGVAITADGTPLPQSTVDTCLASDAVFLGAVGDNKFNSLTPDKRPEAGLLCHPQAPRRLRQPPPLPRLQRPRRQLAAPS